jgi:hypothetical protein
MLVEDRDAPKQFSQPWAETRVLAFRSGELPDSIVRTSFDNFIVACSEAIDSVGSVALCYNAEHLAVLDASDNDLSSVLNTAGKISYVPCTRRVPHLGECVVFDVFRV